MLLESPPRPEDITFTEDYIFWTDSEAGEVRRALRDGTGEFTLVSGLSGLSAIASYGPGEWIYWSDPGGLRIQRSGYDGFPVEDVLTAADGLGEVPGIVIDEVHGEMYFTEITPTESRICRCGMDGENGTVIVTEIGDPVGIALDLHRGHIYWADRAGGMVSRVDLDGQNRLVVVDDIPLPHRIALELEFSDCNGNGSPDACDIALGLSGDSNSNGVPDECEPRLLTPPPRLLERVLNFRP